MKTKIPLKTCETKLERAVARWANSTGQDYENGAEGALSDLFKGGCQSGMVSDLIYYQDTLKFYKRHQADIASLITVALEQTGAPLSSLLRDFDQTDPLCMETQNRNLLAWFGFEEAARNVAGRAGLDF